MVYRREIDGLRALAVVPVVLFHAGFEPFGGGFVGVDVFFVISGYLITSIILAELDQDRFSIAGFYERRARRILPALFLVMAASLVAGYFLLMPDEFKNLGQSLVATALFSNNVLLALTSGYWDLASEFKPLLHTWSLGVEEQYYVVFPLMLLFFWTFVRRRIPLLLALLFIGSLGFSVWFVAISPKWAFFGLPTRAWEILAGALAAIFMRRNPAPTVLSTYSNALSLLGMCFIVGSVFLIDRSHPSPGVHFLVPTMGTVLIIVWAQTGTWAQSILGHAGFVSLGLLSYSLYLWHQPVFAFLRAYSVDEPSPRILGASMMFILLASYLSWRFVERPFRDRKAIGQGTLLGFCLIGSVFFIAAGMYLNRNYGMPQRVFASTMRMEDMDKRIYNERAYERKVDSFPRSDRKKVLIIGNSFARDFTNVTLETFGTERADVVYRDDLEECIFPYRNDLSRSLFSAADVVVFASGDFSSACLERDLAYASDNGKKLYYVGTKDFGYNLNWLKRLDEADRTNRYNVISDAVLRADARMSATIPAAHFVPLLSPMVKGNRVPITDEEGRMLSTDRAHLTKYGAIFFGDKAVRKSGYSSVFE